MALEHGVRYISDLVQTYPTDGDAMSQGDNHLRNIKAALKGTFPRLTGSSQVNQHDLTKLHNISVSANEVNSLEGIEGTVQDRLTDLEDDKLDASQFTSSNILGLIKDVDGEGSGLNADRIDGKSLDFLRNASNLNSGVVSPQRLPLATGDEAREGQASGKLMTPLRTRQTLKRYVPSVANYVDVILSSQTWTVPDDVRFMYVIAIGAGGGGDDDQEDPTGGGDPYYKDGAYGGVVASQFSVTPGDQFVIEVGPSAGNDQDGGRSTFGNMVASGGLAAKRNNGILSGVYNGKRIYRKHLVSAIASVPCNFGVQDAISHVFSQDNSVQTIEEAAVPYGLGGDYLPGCPGGSGPHSSVGGAVFIFYFKQQ